MTVTAITSPTEMPRVSLASAGAATVIWNSSTPGAGITAYAAGRLAGANVIMLATGATLAASDLTSTNND